MDDNLTLEYFLSLLDRAENVFQKDNLGEKSTDYEYSVEDIKREPELEYVYEQCCAHNPKFCVPIGGLEVIRNDLKGGKIGRSISYPT